MSHTAIILHRRPLTDGLDLADRIRNDFVAVELSVQPPEGA